jgi:hypothetical protein
MNGKPTIGLFIMATAVLLLTGSAIASTIADSTPSPVVAPVTIQLPTI